MNLRRPALATLVIAVLMAFAMPSTATAPNRGSNQGDIKAQGRLTLPAAGDVVSRRGLEMYRAGVSGQVLQELRTKGYDVTVTDDSGKQIEVALVLSAGERTALQARGVKLEPRRTKQGLTASRLAAKQKKGGFNVFRSFDERGGLRDEMYKIARNNKKIVKLEVLGESVQGREYIALKLTQDARTLPDNSRPAVLYVSTYHAREWISPEVNRRLLLWYIDQWKKKNPTVTNLLKTTELWFVLVHNPDGYEYTFDAERLWRKNLRDNDGDGVITNADGVDLNRNHSEHWGYDDEGSDPQIAGQTYRGTDPESEPETEAMVSLFEKVDFRFAISYHSFGPLLLYTQGWQVLTPSADDPIYMALTGDDNHPAVAGFNPGVGADLYTTNGEFTDWAHGKRGALAWTPELEEGCVGCGFVFPDNEALVQAQFEKNRQFALNVARSAGDPDDPVSHWGVDTKGLYINEAALDPWKTNWPTSDLSVEVSYAGGSSQPVEVLAKRSLGQVLLRYSIDGAPRAPIPTSPSPPGEIFGGNNAYNEYYHFMRASIPGLSVGDEVEYWFTGGGESSEHVTFDVVEDADADVLIMAAEDYSGASAFPPYPSAAGPFFLDYYTEALDAEGISYDVYDVDAMGRLAPDHLGVLGHYDAVIWYKGNDTHVRPSGWGAGTVSRLAVDEVLEVRQYLNEGGKLLYTGQFAGGTENGLGGVVRYDPVADARCAGGETPPTPEVNARCLRWDDKNDFIQYYLGAYIYNLGAGTDADGNPFPIDGVSDPYAGTDWTLNGGDSADNQGPFNSSFITTSSLLDETTHPQFASDAPAAWDRGIGGDPPFEPRGGSTYYLYSDRADISYKRLGRTLDLTGVAAADNPTMTFFTSYDTEFHWDFLFVEAHTVNADGTGNDDWTTLPDAGTPSHTTQDTGDSCATSFEGGWRSLHPHLDHYQTKHPDDSCTPTGTTGEWHASSGRSQGWEEWEIDLSEYAGDRVELFISYASDWGTQGLGVWVDDITVSHGGGSHGFEDGTTDGWTVAGAPPGSDPNPNDWHVTTSVGYEEGAVVSTDDTLFFGFGFEGITTEAEREDVMCRSVDYLGVACS